MRVSLLLIAGLAVSVLCHASSAQAEKPTQNDIPAALKNYVDRDDSSFAWKLLQKQQTPAGTIYQLEVTSQTWQGIVWKHAVEVYEPTKVTYPGHALLFVTGGSRIKAPDEDDLTMGFTLAKLSGARVAVLHQVPNQPLLGNRVEDDLITETWLKYLKTGDETWPLLFPMVKSAVKTMDAVEQLSKRDWDEPVDSFVITGGSKRGWTSWLTPVADKRVVATAPIVIDVLNFRAQMKHQKATWGKYSEQISDYSSKGLIVEGEETERECNLRLMMDPYTYRSTLKLPKLLINGTNDRYWVVDAMQWYWDDLSGPKYALFLPNVGHGLGKERRKALSTVAAYVRHVASKRALPELKWNVKKHEGTLQLDITSTAVPRGAKLWSARSQDLDFRDDEWSAVDLSGEKRSYNGSIPLPKEKNHVACYGELQFEIDGVPFSLTTLITRE